MSFIRRKPQPLRFAYCERDFRSAEGAILLGCDEIGYQRFERIVLSPPAGVRTQKTTTWGKDVREISIGIPIDFKLFCFLHYKIFILRVTYTNMTNTNDL
jgi:hypothetical protein